MTNDEREQFRHECECREWLRRGHTTRASVERLISRIQEKRGRPAAERVREGMREEYRQRQQAGE